MSKFKLGKSSKENRRGVDPRLIEMSDRAIELTMVDFGHGPMSGIRTAEIQNALFQDGKSKADGYTHKSNHQTGKALDFYAYVNGGASWNPSHLAMVGAAFLQAANELGYVVEWGGLWRGKDPVFGWDMPHIQLVD